MTNELIIADKVEKRLRTPRQEIIFPLASNHRKELRELRDKNIGELKGRLKTLKTLKREEFVKNNDVQFKKELQIAEKNLEKLNNHWEDIIEQVNTIIETRKELENKYRHKHFRLENSYSNFTELKKLTKSNDYRKFTMKVNNISKELSEELFNKKYGKAFDEVSKIIDDLYTKYEEAINFGDLEIVRQLYYTLKDSDKLFEKISNMKV